MKLLGSGTYGTVSLMDWDGQPAALKVAKSSEFSEMFESEGNVLSLLNGAGGAPLLLHRSVNPPSLVTTYKGNQTLLDVLRNPQYDLLDVGLQVGIKLNEIHAAGLVHNDIKCDNIMIQGPPHKPNISIIDYGLASRNRVKIFLEEDSSIDTTYAPEVLQKKASTFASDVYSYGKLMLEIQKQLPEQHPSLDKLLQKATNKTPRRRPTLPIFLRRLREVISEISTSVKNSCKKQDTRAASESIEEQHRMELRHRQTKRDRSPTPNISTEYRRKLRQRPKKRQQIPEPLEANNRHLGRNKRRKIAL
nr:serine/threonine-protein kinase EDR1-like [Procambarus clarkii]